jgi:hypothetical protein
MISSSVSCAALAAAVPAEDASSGSAPPAAAAPAAPPISSLWIEEIVRLVDQGKVPLLRNKKRIYGSPGQISATIIRILKKSFEEDHSFYPWLHQRLGLWKESDRVRLRKAKQSENVEEEEEVEVEGQKESPVSAR